jgi:hypothetical protein
LGRLGSLGGRLDHLLKVRGLMFAPWGYPVGGVLTAWGSLGRAGSLGRRLDHLLEVRGAHVCPKGLSGGWSADDSRAPGVMRAGSGDGLIIC